MARTAFFLAVLCQPASHAATEPFGLEAVIVTARKIEEDARQVPMSVQALSADYLDVVDRSSLYELQFSIPGLVVNNLGLFGAGMALRGVSDQTGTARVVAPHMNGVYLGSSELAITRMYDLERIEVLKGPQGSLYGRNSTAGSINVITRAPADTWSAGVEAAYGSFGTARAEGHVNVPLSDAGLRLAFLASEGDGYIRNTADARRFAENDYWGARVSARFEAGPRTRLEIMAQHMADDGASGELWSPNPQFLPDPRDIRLATVTLESPYLDIENTVATLRVAHDLDGSSVQSITGYARNSVRDLDDCAGNPFLAGCVRGGTDSYSQWSEELQYRFRNGDVQGVAGFYYHEDESNSTFHQLIPNIGPAPMYDNKESGSETVAALFGQATLQVAGSWSLTGGLRLSREVLHFTTVGGGTLDSPAPLSNRNRSDDVAWRLDAAYEVREDLRLYAAVATGYRSGALQLIDGEPANAAPETIVAYEAGLKAASLDRRLSLDASAFFYDYDDMQVTTTTLDANVYIDNAARARLYGIDAAARWSPNGPFGFSAAVVWMPEREFVEYVNRVTGDTLSGNKLERAPETSATLAADYAQPMPAGGILRGRIEYAYRSDYYYSEGNEDVFRQDGFGLLNAFIRYESAGGRWSVFATGRNLTEEDYFHQVFIQSSPGLPATWEAGVDYRF